MDNRQSSTRLPAVGDLVWHVHLGKVRSGRVSKVDPPGRPMGYAAVFVTANGGTCCVHGANPSIKDDTNHWYWTEAEAQAVAELEQERREATWAAKSRHQRTW